ncbi:MAG: hypothetical protein QXU32_00790 [Nitrososphaerales archaeon]
MITIAELIRHWFDELPDDYRRAWRNMGNDIYCLVTDENISYTITLDNDTIYIFYNPTGTPNNAPNAHIGTITIYDPLLFDKLRIIMWNITNTKHAINH